MGSRKLVSVFRSYVTEMSANTNKMLCILFATRFYYSTQIYT